MSARKFVSVDAGGNLSETPETGRDVEDIVKKSAPRVEYHMAVVIPGMDADGRNVGGETESTWWYAHGALYPVGDFSRWRILTRFFYYDGTLNTPKDHFVHDKYGDVLEFDAYDEAEEYAERLRGALPSPYVMAHGEFARPEYKPVPVEVFTDCYEVEYFRGFERVEADALPPSVRDELENANVHFFSETGTSGEVWAYCVERPDEECGYAEVEYCVVYGVRTAASDAAARTGDMSSLDWEHETYWKGVI